MLTKLEILEKLPTATKAERRELLKLARELDNDPLYKFRNKIVQGDCLDVMKDIPDNSINLILTDPPYHRVKKDTQWDMQWKTANDFLNWIDKIAEQWQRILKPNGSLYCFASPKMSARVEVKLSERFNICNHIVWDKNGRSRAAMTCKEESRIYFPESERIIFCEHYDADNIAKGEAGYGAKCDELRGFVFEPLQQYFKSLQERTGNFWDGDLIPQIYLDSGIASNLQSARVIAKHKLDWNYKQFEFITEKHYNLLNPVLQFTKSYEELRLQYEELRQQYEELRRPFAVTADVPYTDVWTFKTVQAYKGKHICEKPSAMLEHIIKASSREGDTVLDCFAGSGSTLFAAKKLNRQFIGIELDQHWVNQINNKLENN